MGRRHRAIILAIFLMVASALVVLLLPEHGPTWKGAPLEVWLERYWAGGSWEGEDPTAAIRAMGQPAVAQLTEWLRYEPAPVREKLQDLLASVKIIRVRGTPAAEMRADKALGLFRALGPAASNAVPRLLTMLTDTKAPWTARQAMWALSAIGEPALDPLLRLLADKRTPNRDMVVVAIADMKLDRRAAAHALPLLTDCTIEPDPMVVEPAILAFGSLDFPPETAAPALLSKLDDPHPEVRFRAVSCLAKYAVGTHKEKVERALRRLLSDPDQETREAATNALAQIALEALTNAPTP